ncbi:MAG TPA: MBL fold metallo-hydrolase [Rhizobacter sp.]|nr:MBL fold metallo-hydrolase [Rhizobacter sp.]
MKKLTKRVLLGVAGVLVAGVAFLAWQDRPLDAGAVAGLPEIPAEWPAVKPPQGLALSVLRTGESAGTVEALVVAGGSWFTPRKPVHSAVLVRHPQGTLLFDTGLGREVAAQFAVNGAIDREFFGYRAEEPAAAQLARHGVAASSLMAIVPSHMHWDHVSGLPDFPDTEVWVQPTEREHAAQGHPPAFLQSQFSGVKRWRDLRFDATPYMGFAAQRDVFGDGSVVLVPLAGHTAGHVGLFVHLPSGRRYFFTGDVTWTIEGLRRPADRPWITRTAVKLDHDKADNRRAIVQIHRLMQRHPQLTVVPAHDENVARTLPRFPTYQE